MILLIFFKFIFDFEKTQIIREFIELIGSINW